MKKTLSAFVAAFLLLICLLAIPTVRLKAATAYTTLVDVHLLNSLLDATAIGATTPSTAVFTTATATTNFAGILKGRVLPNDGSTCGLVNVGGPVNSFPCFGGYTTFGIVSGEVDWVDSPGANTAGFNWYETGSTTSPGTLVASLDASGNFHSNGSLSSGTGIFTGNAATATALQNNPTNCAGGTVSTGIATSGNANCTARPAITGSQVLLPTTALCTPSTSTDASCTGSISFTAFSDTAYTVSATTYDTSGANLLFTMTGKFTGSISYTLTCTFNCGSFSGPAADIRIYHP